MLVVVLLFSHVRYAFLLWLVGGDLPLAGFSPACFFLSCRGECIRALHSSTYSVLFVFAFARAPACVCVGV